MSKKAKDPWVFQIHPGIAIQIDSGQIIRWTGEKDDFAVAILTDLNSDLMTYYISENGVIDSGLKNKMWLAELNDCWEGRAHEPISVWRATAGAIGGEPKRAMIWEKVKRPRLEELLEPWGITLF